MVYYSLNLSNYIKLWPNSITIKFPETKVLINFLRGGNKCYTAYTANSTGTVSVINLFVYYYAARFVIFAIRQLEHDNIKLATILRSIWLCLTIFYCNNGFYIVKSWYIKKLLKVDHIIYFCYCRPCTTLKGFVVVVVVIAIVLL